MGTEPSAPLALARLLQLSSPSLPVGAYSYSQGIEWAVESGWIDSRESLCRWLADLAESSLAHLELPILRRLLAAWSADDIDTVARWSETLLASRETRELRDEERQRARAFGAWLHALEPAAGHRELLETTQLTGYALACRRWGIGYREAATAWLWSWCENAVLAAVKIVPLGQTDGQKAIFELSARIPGLVERAAALEDAEIGAGAMALAIASARHETQYTRLFRS